MNSQTEESGELDAVKLKLDGVQEAIGGRNRQESHLCRRYVLNVWGCNAVYAEPQL